jgi:hypothetical protein
MQQGAAMKKINHRLILKNIIVAITLGVAGVASWALTELRTPSLEAQVAPFQAH